MENSWRKVSLYEKFCTKMKFLPFSRIPGELEVARTILWAFLTCHLHWQRAHQWCLCSFKTLAKKIMKDYWLSLRWKLPLFKSQGYINRVIHVSGWFVLTSICWTWPRMTRSGSRKRAAAPIEDAGGIWRKVSIWPLSSSGHALSCHKWNSKEQFWSLKGREWSKSFYRPVV